MLSPDKGTTKKNPTKPKLSRKILEDDHVLFYDSVHNLPGWLRPIQAQMSKVRTRIPPDLEPVFKADLDRFKDSGQDAGKALEEHWSLSPPKGDKGYRPNKRFGKDRELAKVERELIKKSASWQYSYGKQECSSPSGSNFYRQSCLRSMTRYTVTQKDMSKCSHYSDEDPVANVS